jgi:hypothetical protein
MPGLFVASALAILLALHLAASGGNLTGFILFGRTFAAWTHPPAGALVGSPNGYDGQFFYVQARDPLLLHSWTVAALKTAGCAFRLQRMAYPALAFVLGGGRVSALPTSMLATNVLILLGGCIAFAVYAHRRNWPTKWAVALTLMPGMLLPALRDLSDPLATVSVVTGVLLAHSGRRWAAAVALTIAVLTREAMMVIVVAVALHAAFQAWTQRRDRRWETVLVQSWPQIVVPSAAFLAWQVYITLRTGGFVGSPAGGFPVSDLVKEIHSSLTRGPFLFGVWDNVYVILIAVAVMLAAWSLVRRRTLVAAAAVAASLGVLIPTFGDSWSDTRLSAPLFALLLIDGLQHNDRLAIRICGGAAAMSVVALLVIPGVLW